MSSDEHDLNRRIDIGKLTLKIKAAQTRESHVEDKATRCIGALGSCEFLGSLERLRSEANRAKKPREGFTHQLIVVDDKHHRVVAAHGF